MKTQFLLLFLLVIGALSAQVNYKTDTNISYVAETETDGYRRERCVLDVYYPEGVTDFPTIVWYHGGGLTGGSKDIPRELKEQGCAVVTVNYRLSPRATAPAYILDAAEALAWAFKHIGKYGGTAEKIYVSGHSAGGYLALMLALDKSYLAAHEVDADRVAAWIPLSGQTVTHYTIRKEMGLKDGIPVIERYAPLSHARPDTPPIMLITGGRYLEMSARYEENALLDAVLRGVGNKNVSLYELEGCDHGTMCGPGCLMMVDYIRKKERR
ncbi:alpha/beta hydrolase [Parabacteroides sp. OttesenSCG-928-J18]|nr:alpha/beta hydrolase [Parabacteroides sp. OttesenSCG-928-J18]